MKKFITIIGIALIIILMMIVKSKEAEAITKTPTDYANNITGRLRLKISATKTANVSVTADTYNTASGSSPVTFPTGEMILRFSRRTGNKNSVECVAVASGTTQSNATVTLGTLTRNISCDEGDQFTSNGDGLVFPGGTIVELTWGVHQAENTVYRDNANEYSASGAIKFTGSGSFDLPRIASDAARDLQYPNPADGRKFYHTGDDAEYTRVAGSWVLTASGGVVNAGYGNAGKVELATPTEIFNGTASGAASLVPAVKDIVTSSSGGSNIGHIVALSGGGIFHGSVLGRNNDETSTGSGEFLRKDNAGKSVWTESPAKTGSGVNIDIDVTNTTEISLTATTFSQISANLQASMTIESGDLLHFLFTGSFQGSATACALINFDFQIGAGHIGGANGIASTSPNGTTADGVGITVSFYHITTTGGTVNMQPLYRVNANTCTLQCDATNASCKFQVVKIR